jgi:hypothetical protein
VSRAVRPTRLLLLAALLVGAALGAPSPAGAAAPTVWLCKPGKVPDPCRSALTSTVLSTTRAAAGTESAAPARRPGIDCFYVYPTVSDQQTPAADLTVDPAQRAIAQFQASRFSQVCRVFAPMYRQITLQGLGRPATVTAAMRQKAYADVRDAWHEYLRRDNNGRGVVLIGHSQGTFILRRLIAAEIDGKPAVRRRLVSALLLGGDVLVRKGRDSGGDFRHLRACRSPGQLQCVVAFSTYNAPVPADSVFGRPPVSDRGRLQVLCTNPAALRGGAGLLDSYEPTAVFPGTLGLAIGLMQGETPRVPTPWFKVPHGFRARCSTAGGASVLQVAARGSALTLKASPDASWGLHLADVNIGLGNLVSLVRRQAAGYARRTTG